MTQASSVIPVVSCNDAELGMLTRAFVPLNTSALPNRPAVVQVAPLSVPVLLLPDESATVVPEPWLKEYAATRPGACALADEIQRRIVAVRHARKVTVPRRGSERTSESPHTRF